MRTVSDFLKSSNLYAVIFGGRGEEHRISCISAANFISCAQKNGFDILKIGISPSGIWNLYSGDTGNISDGSWISDTDSLTPAYPVRLGGCSGFLIGGYTVPVRGAVPILHGDFGEDGRVQGALECAGISFFGCDTVAGAVSSDKAYTKAVAEKQGIPTLPWIMLAGDLLCDAEVERAANAAEAELSYPIFIKPSRLGSSIGAGIADTRATLVKLIKNAYRHGGSVIAERALINKTELECAYFCADGREIIAPPGAIFANHGFYDFCAKYENVCAKIFVRADIPSDVSERIISYTRTMKSALGIRGSSRFDYFLSADGEIYFNEVNTIPGMTAESLYPAMLEMSGVPFSELIGLVLRESEKKTTHSIREGEGW